MAEWSQRVSAVWSQCGSAVWGVSAVWSQCTSMYETTADTRLRLT